VEFTADTLKLNLIDLGRTESKLITVAGHVDFMCQEVEAADPVTFTTRDSNLVSLVSLHRFFFFFIVNVTVSDLQSDWNKTELMFRLVNF
jgi:leucine-rich repeat transmembrane neuronal protein 1/2